MWLHALVTVSALTATVSASTNIALNREAYQSNNYYTSTGFAGEATDGNTDATPSHCTFTKSLLRPWWIVDLGQRYFITQVKITTRNDKYSNRLADFDISVGDEFRKDDNSFNPTQFYDIFFHAGTFPAGETKAFDITQFRAGRYLRIQLRGTNILTVCEVQVFGVTHSAATQAMLDAEAANQKADPNLARDKSAYQINNYYSTGTGLAGQASDGKTDPTPSTCSFTKSFLMPWWIVDLDGRYFINKVYITTRGDHYTSRLANFDISIGDGFRKVDNSFNPTQFYDIYHQPGAFLAGETKLFEITSMRAGRYLRIQLRDTNVLTLCEVQVFGVAYADATSAMLAEEAKYQKDDRDHSLYRPAYQISNHYTDSGRAGLASDGKVNSTPATCSFTKSQLKPWWIVDLGQKFFVDKVYITTRSDSYSTRLANFDISIGENCEAFRVEDNAFNPTLFHDVLHVTTAPRPMETKLYTIPAAKRRAGRFVKIQLRGTEILTLCEVQVFGALYADATTDVALGQASYQVSNHYATTGFAGLATDGKTDTDSAKCTHTKSQLKPWWIVDLGSEFAVNKVYITNRNDKYSSRLADFDIFIGNDFNRYVGTFDSTKFQNIMHVPDAILPGDTKLVCTDASKSGRYLAIQLRSTDTLGLCEVQVYTKQH